MVLQQFSGNMSLCSACIRPTKLKRERTSLSNYWVDLFLKHLQKLPWLLCLGKLFCVKGFRSVDWTVEQVWEALACKLNVAEFEGLPEGLNLLDNLVNEKIMNFVLHQLLLQSLDNGRQHLYRHLLVVLIEVARKVITHVFEKLLVWFSKVFLERLQHFDWKCFKLGNIGYL